MPNKARHPIPDPRLEFSERMCSLEALRVCGVDRRFGQAWMRFDVSPRIIMLDQSENALTWKIAGEWITTDFDLFYEVRVTRYKMVQNSSQKYEVDLMYHVEGSKLFIGGLRCDGNPKDFEFKSLIDLSSIVPFTEQIMQVEKAGLFSVTPKSWICGEDFFGEVHSLSSIRHSTKFTVYYPRGADEYKIREALDFCRSLKAHIRSLST